MANVKTIHKLIQSPLSEAQVAQRLTRVRTVDEGALDMVKKALDAVKGVGDSVKNFIETKAQKIGEFFIDKCITPLKDFVNKLVPGYKWGGFKDNPDGMVAAILEISMKQKKEGKGSRWLLTDRELVRSGTLSESEIKQFRRGVRTLSEGKTLNESGVISMIMATIHWSHFSLEVVEIVLEKIVPMIPAAAKLLSFVHGIKAEDFEKKHPKLAGVAKFYEDHKTVIDAVCITIGIVEIIIGAGPLVIASTIFSAGWAIGEKLWHLYKSKAGDSEAAKIAEK